MSSCPTGIYLCLEYVPPRAIRVCGCQWAGVVVLQHFNLNFYWDFLLLHVCGSVCSENTSSFSFFDSTKHQGGHDTKDFFQSLPMGRCYPSSPTKCELSFIWGLQSDSTQALVAVPCLCGSHLNPDIPRVNADISTPFFP